MKAFAAGQFLQFSEKSRHFNVIWMMFCMFLEQLEKAKLMRKEPGGEATSHWAILAIFQEKKTFQCHLDNVLNVFRVTRKS